MKKIIAVNAVLLAMCFSCKKETPPVVDNEPEEEYIKKDPLKEECFVGVLKKDTVSLQLNSLDKDVRSGTLAYKFFEKDKNNGHVSGKIYGDTIVLMYNFMSEGSMSSREVAFLRKGDTLLEGYGEVSADSAGTTKFKDRSKLRFDTKLVLAKTNCK